MNEQLNIFNQYSDGNIFDLFLTHGGNRSDSRMAIIGAFERGIAVEDVARLMKKKYCGSDGINEYCCSYKDDGVYVSYGNSVTSDAKYMSWKQFAKRAKYLLDNSMYASVQQCTNANYSVMDETAKNIWYMIRDLDIESPYAKEYFCHGYDNDIHLLKINMVERQDQLKKYLRILSNQYKEDKSIMRFHFHNPVQCYKEALYAMMPRTYSFTGMDMSPVKRFITEDEILSMFKKRGSGISEWQKRIKAFFDEHKETNERVSFLKNEYGIGGSSHALSGANGSSENHDAKGIMLKKLDCDDVLITYKQAIKYFEKVFGE